MEPLNNLLQAVAGPLGPYAPRILGALVILLVAWIAARIARSAVRRLAVTAKLDERLKSPELVDVLSNLGYWLVWLFALPALLGTLQLEGLLAPVNAMISRLLGFVPNLMGAVVIFGVGFLAARILRQVVSGILMAAGSEKLADRLGMAGALGERTLAGVGGSIVFALVLLPTLTAALQALGLEAIAKPVGGLLDSVIALVPKLISALVIFGIGAILGRIVAGIVTTALSGLGVNALPARLGLGDGFRLGGRDLSELAGGVVMAAALLTSLMQALEIIGLDVLTHAAASLATLMAALFGAAIVLAAGLWMATVAARLVEGSAIPNARVLGHVVRAAILFFAAALALRQAGLPGDIVAIAFGSVIGGIGIGVAIALGLGGRKVAARLLEAAVASFERKKSGNAVDAG
ncbi:MAG TPA: mechanosensitive ion channel [Burkholderiaceae bacterium]|nr:mechanosensitive ion channel [Burkholderiaceae bacterium]